MQEFEYGEIITNYEDKKDYVIVQIGQATHTKTKETYPLLYTQRVNYPYTVKIFLGTRYLREIKNPEVFEKMKIGFEEEILNNPDIDARFKIFDPKERRKHERKEKKELYQQLAVDLKQIQSQATDNQIDLAILLEKHLQKRRRIEESLARVKYLMTHKDEIPPLTPEEEAETAEFFKDVTYSVRKSNRKGR